MRSDFRLYFVSVLLNISVSLFVSVNEIISFPVSISISVNEYITEYVRTELNWTELTGSAVCLSLACRVVRSDGFLRRRIRDDVIIIIIISCSVSSSSSRNCCSSWCWSDIIRRERAARWGQLHPERVSGSWQQLSAIVILSVCLSRPDTDSSPGRIETPGFHHMIA